MPSFRTVTGRWTAKAPDGRDSDIHPDGVPLWGHVRIEPIYQRGKLAYPTVANARFVEPQTIPARLIDGDLAVAVLVEDPDHPEDDHYVAQPVSLLVSEDPAATQTWTYRLHFDHITVGEDGQSIDLPVHTFSVPPGDEPLDLVDTIGEISGAAVVTGRVDRLAETVTGLDGRLVTAEDLIAQHAGRLTAVEAKAVETREIVDRIKFPPFSKGKPVGDAPPGTLVLDVETFDVWEATE